MSKPTAGVLGRSSEELYHHEKYDCADECGKDRSHQSTAQGHTYSWQEVARDNRAEHANDNVAPQAEPAALTISPASQPAIAPTTRKITSASIELILASIRFRPRRHKALHPRTVNLTDLVGQRILQRRPATSGFAGRHATHFSL